MIYSLICRQCGTSFSWKTHFKKVCPSCLLKNRNEVKKRWSHSEKGKQCYQRRLERMRKKPKRQPSYCIDCGKRLGRINTRCRDCFLKFLKTQTMERHPNWKGGIAKEGGYILIKTPRHPRADKKGRVRQHILVWEKAHNKPLPQDWIIHHLNGIKDDNRPANLIALPNKKHYLVLQAKAKRIQELEAMVNHQAQLL